MTNRLLPILMITLTILISGCGGNNSEGNNKTVQDTKRIDPAKFEIIATDHNKPHIENFHVWVKLDSISEEILTKFALDFKHDYCTIDCNIQLYDTPDIKDLIDVYPLEGEDYVYFADHFIGWLSFDVPDKLWYYPYRDVLYKEHGGTH